MDWSHFGLERQPFRPAVDPDSYFPSPSHEAAIAELATAFARRDPAVLIDGASGVGKSLVVRKWLEHLLPDVPRVVLPNCRAERPAELLQAILFDLGEPYQGRSEQELRLEVTDKLLALADGGFPTVIMIDEAQHLSQLALEELRLLGNLETRLGVVAFTVLVAHPMLRDALRRPAYELFAQRVAMQARVEPLTSVESADYLRHQIRASGGEPARVFDDAAVALLTTACVGIPRVLNRAAALSMELATTAGAESVDAEAVLESLDRLGIEAVEIADPTEPVLLPHPARSAEPARSGRAKSATFKDADEAGTARVSKDKSSRRHTA